MAAKKRARRRPASLERRYEVKAEIENFSLVKAKSALKLEIYCRAEKLGELQVGRGSLYWWGAHRQKEKRVSWGRFAQMMDELAYGKK
jgi:hypothetical protein